MALLPTGINLRLRNKGLVLMVSEGSGFCPAIVTGCLFVIEGHVPVCGSYGRMTFQFVDPVIATGISCARAVMEITRQANSIAQRQFIASEVNFIIFMSKFLLK